MNKSIEKEIEFCWQKIISSYNATTNISEHRTYSIQDWSFVISQLVIPTISLLLQMGYLKYSKDILKRSSINNQSKTGCNSSNEDEIENTKNEIKDILNNYNLSDVDLKKVISLFDNIKKND